MNNKCWVTLHCTDSEVHELCININNIETIEESSWQSIRITMVSGKVWNLKDYTVDELQNIFDERVTT